MTLNSLISPCSFKIFLHFLSIDSCAFFIFHLLDIFSLNSEYVVELVLLSRHLSKLFFFLPLMPDVFWTADGVGAEEPAEAEARAGAAEAELLAMLELEEAGVYGEWTGRAKGKVKGKAKGKH